MQITADLLTGDLESPLAPAAGRAAAQVPPNPSPATVQRPLLSRLRVPPAPTPFHTCLPACGGPAVGARLARDGRPGASDSDGGPTGDGQAGGDGGGGLAREPAPPEEGGAAVAGAGGGQQQEPR